ncbi:hypothetical protein M0R72_02095 [Candidatus Pacearchaeota archaeon]|jgi:hypothetical protein|nr:hypothetical protein [Candidatus Pacearchaeota archaeon]
MKRHLKLAEIRKNDESPCPFGLPIPFGCQNAGEHVDQMAPFDVMGKDVSEDEKEMLSAANTKLLAWNLLRSTDKPSPCKYAGHILEHNNAAECNHDDSAPGQGPAQPLMPAPYYSKMFNGIITGLTTYPAGYLSDYNQSRNIYFGVYSTQGSSERRDLLRMAAEEIASIAKYTNNSE